MICEMSLIKGDALVARWEGCRRQTLSHDFHHHDQLGEGDTRYDRP